MASSADQRLEAAEARRVYVWRRMRGYVWDPDACLQDGKLVLLKQHHRNKAQQNMAM